MSLATRFKFLAENDINCKKYDLGPGRIRQIFAYFAKKFVIISVIQVRPVIFFPILSSIAKLQRRRRPALEQDKFLSGVKNHRTDFTIRTVWSK